MLMLSKYNNGKIEKYCIQYWKEDGIYKFDENSDKPIYSIDTPPPFTSGQLHMGHILSYSFFDFIARYKRMRGFNVFYPQGWDTQGFPTEVKVEKKYGRLPPEEFRKKCIEWTEEFIKVMKSEMDEIGFSPDWNYEYRTMDPKYHKKVQYSLIEMYKKEAVYRGQHPVFWCPKCRSAIAKAETEESQKSGTLNYIIFKGPAGEDLQIATTRPELMHACTAVMFHPEDERYLHLKGKEIETALGKKVNAISDKDVQKEFGTGLLMVCTFGDIQDVIWTHRHNLPIIEAIDDFGKLINSNDFDGLKIEDARKKIIEKLKQEGKIIKQEPLNQSVKVHDRCRGTIELKNSMQWFAKIKENKEFIKNLAKKIKWIPEFGIHYLEDWADNVDWDWCISRHRVFGTPLPFYVCENCNYTQPVEIEKLPFSKETAEIKLCPECKNKLIPEPTVADVWVDSSITPLIISKWGEDEKFFKKIYPVNLRPQGVEIIRTWAFYTIFRSGFLTATPPFKSILLNGNVLATDGKKMSKSTGNVISLPDLKEKYPMDALRQWAALSGAMAKDRPFSFEDLNRSKAFVLKLWNASSFVQKSIEDFDKKTQKELRLIDRWILSRLNDAIEEYTNYMEKFEYHHALSKMHQFFWNDFCDNYLEYTKYRIYENIQKPQAQYSLYNVILSSIKLLAPIMPFETEAIYQDIMETKKSIHSSTWPEKVTGISLTREEFEQIELFNKIISDLRQYKASNRLALNTQLNSVNLILDRDFSKELADDLKKIMKIQFLKIEKGKYSIIVE
ncbi:MAG: valine--tRNA ligase [Candidatus Micrarchaeia archaeon]